jgi:stearoyl-CoA desaturase (delta-9 desaturase)
MYFNGLLHLSFWGDVLAVVILTQITVASVTLYLHRCQAHRALELSPTISHFFRGWLWLTTGMNTKAWTAIHRKHHAKCEMEGDPHSPQILGINKVLFEGAELYKLEANNQETLENYGKGTPDDWMENKIYTPHGFMGLIIMLFIDLILFGLPGISIWGIQMLWIPFFAAGIINGVGHYFGYRNFESKDASRNIIPIGLIVGGEELHNNHHAFGSSAKFSSKWWEFDIGWFYIKILSFFKLAKVKKLPPKLISNPNKSVIDTETLKAIIINKLNVLSSYSKEVILPVLKKEQQQAGEKFSHAKKLLVKELSMISSFDRKSLALLFKKTKMLRKVYFYRERLQDIWNKTTLNQKELIEELQAWCKKAEESGIEVLQNFSLRLKSLVSEGK